MSENKTIRHFEDLGFTVVIKPDEHVVEYVVYDIEGVEDNGKILWHKKNSPRHPDYVETLEEAEPYLHGSVKWDGCSNWHFDEQDRVMLHGCCKEDIERFGKIMGICWELNREFCSNFNP